jgi:iron complex outermembrane receptor protein
MALSAIATGALVPAAFAQDASASGGNNEKAARPTHETTALDAVKVSASATDTTPYAGGQLARGGSLGILGTANTMDVPFSTANYTSETLRNQQARTLADVVVNEASVRVLTSSGGFGEDFQIRGYTVASSDVGVNGLYGLASASRMPAAIMERVEVLKGPGTLMYGIGPSGSVGGAINIVTKRADDEPLTRLTTTYQSSSQFGQQADIGRRFGKDNAWGIRFNGVYADGETGIRGGNQRPTLGALALDYRGSSLRWSLDAYDQREHTRDFRPQIGFLSTVSALPKIPSARDNFFPGTELTLHDSTVATRVEYDVTSDIMVYAAGGYRYGTAEQTFPSGSADALGNFTVNNAYYDSYSRTKTGDVGMRAHFDTFGIPHTLTLGATRLDQEAGNAYIRSNTPVASSLYDPVDLPPVTDKRTSPRKASNTTLTSYSLTDTASFADNQWLITAGLRHQTVALDNYVTATGARSASYDESAVSPLAGVVYKPLENVSVYANFTSGLSRGGTAPTTAANAGQVFPPFKSKQYETGVKVDWGNVNTTVSVFQVSRPNAVTDPATHIYSFDGEQRNRGLELSGYGEIAPGLRMMASATFYDATLSRTAGGINDGNEANGVPRRTFNMGLDWDTPWIRGLAFSARAISNTSTYFNAANTLKIPGWTRYDAGARFSTTLGSTPVVFRANVENLFNRNFWLLSGTYATVAAPRTLLVSAQIDF